MHYAPQRRVVGPSRSRSRSSLSFARIYCSTPCAPLSNNNNKQLLHIVWCPSFLTGFSRAFRPAAERPLNSSAAFPLFCLVNHFRKNIATLEFTGRSDRSTD
jgi:hypothetical protein